MSIDEIEEIQYELIEIARMLEVCDWLFSKIRHSITYGVIDDRMWIMITMSLTHEIEKNFGKDVAHQFYCFVLNKGGEERLLDTMSIHKHRCPIMCGMWFTNQIERAHDASI